MFGISAWQNQSFFPFSSELSMLRDITVGVCVCVCVGHRIEAIARAPLWAAGLDYRHGTGHGVGSFLCVHEGTYIHTHTRMYRNWGTLTELFLSVFLKVFCIRSYGYPLSTVP